MSTIRVIRSGRPIGRCFTSGASIYTIGAANRRLGFHPPSPYAVWRDWREFASRAYEFPLAD